MLASEDAPDELPTAGGRLAWGLAGDLDLVGALWTDLPFRLSRRDALFFGIDARLGLAQPSDFTFKVTDLQYRLEAGWRGRPQWARGHALTGALASRGREQVDQPGQPWVHYALVGAESPAFRDRRVGGGPGARLDWRVEGGLVFDEREVEADAVVAGEASLWITRAAKGAVALDLEWDALVGDGFEPDFEVGPRFSLPVSDGRRVSVYLHYRGADNPLGNDESLLLAGLAYDEGRKATLTGPEPPQIDGQLSAGGGEGRLSGEMLMRFLFPRVGRAWYPLVWIDGNILTAEDTGDLYFLYSLGAERPWKAAIVGAWFFHRSNHVLAEPNDEVTSMNVLESGIETPSWHSPAGRTPRKLDGYFHAGWLASSSFGEDRPWHVRAGGRWCPLGLAHLPRPFVVAEAESGDVRRERAAVGVAPLEDLELQVEYRYDEQLFAGDRTAILFLARYGF